MERVTRRVGNASMKRATLRTGSFSWGRVTRKAEVSSIRRVVPVQWCLACLSAPRFFVTIENNCIVQSTFMMLVFKIL